jgi:hypothetical protein
MGTTIARPGPTISRLEHPESTGGHDYNLLDAPLANSGVASQLAGQQDFSISRLLIPLSISQVERDLTAIRTDMSEATAQLLASVGNVRRATMPLSPTVSSSALALQVKCWGLQWSSVRSELVDRNLFPAVEVLMSLCSAFLTNIFDRQCSACVAHRNQSRSKDGTHGRAISSLLEHRKYPARLSISSTLIVTPADIWQKALRSSSMLSSATIPIPIRQKLRKLFLR